MTAVSWPTTLQVTGIATRRPRFMERSGGASLSGLTQYVATGAGQHRFGITIQVRTMAHLKTLRGFLWELRGSAGTVAVPFSNLTDHTSTTAQVDNGPLAAGSTSVNIKVIGGVGPVGGGDYFSRNDRLHVVTTRSPIVGTVSGSDIIYSVDFGPPTRESWADNAALTFTNPTCEMRLLNDESGSIELDVLKMGSATLEFESV